MCSEHNRAVRTEFRRQSPTFEGEDSFFADARLAAWVARHLEPLDSSMLVLEVACGGAHQGEAIAPHVGRVVGADLTPEMLDVARRRLRDRSLDGVALARADAARLPFPDDSFDVTFCRFAVHHFAEPREQLDEMVRVARPSGRVAVVDLISADPELASAYNDVERRRDPSHTRALTADELERAVEDTGTALEHTTRVDVRARSSGGSPRPRPHRTSPTRSAPSCGPSWRVARRRACGPSTTATSTTPRRGRSRSAESGGRRREDQQPALRSVAYGLVRSPLTPPSRISKCRCGPVALPVWPTRPIGSPCPTPRSPPPMISDMCA